jgi:response regulator RpfG family c-di-GMP phosphodiesterase
MADELQRAHDPMTGTGGARPHEDAEGGTTDLPPAAERISVAGTLVDASRLMTELLRFVAPDVHRRTTRITAIVAEVVHDLDLSQPWEFEVAARLSQIGCLTLPPTTLEAVTRGDALSEEDDRAFASHPLVARDLLAEVRRLGDAREMIARQREPWMVPGAAPAPADRVSLGAQLLRIVSDYEGWVEKGVRPSEAMGRLEADSKEYDPQLLRTVRAAVERLAAPAGQTLVAA